ncbi:MAG: oligoendopeptidase F [Faecousia sp.]
MDEIKTIPSREEIPEQSKWAIEDLYATQADWERDLEALREQQSTLEAFAGTLGSSGETLYRYLDAMERMNVKAERLGNYCMRRADEDTRNAACQAMQGRFMSVVVALSSACSFDTPEIMAIPEETLCGFYRDCPQLERYRRYLTDLRRRKAHTLSAAEEKLLAAAGEMAQTPDTVYDALADADLRFRDAVDAEGKLHPLTQGTFVQLEESPDRVLRKSAYENLYDGFGDFRNTAAAVLNGQNKQLKFFADARKYGSALEASLDANNVPVSVYENLIAAVHEKLPAMHRYVRLRKKLLGVDELHFYDIYTPLVPDVNRHIPFEQAKQTVYDALAPLGDEYRAILQEGFDNRWIDVYQNQGKRSGAYSAGAAVHPYVLLNYTGTLDSQFTLAHEMGHALHSYLSNHNQNPIDADYVIFVAEVASTCNEALLMEYLLGKTTDRKERAYLINHFLDQFKGTIYRQTMFAEYERNIGALTAQGQTLTADVLCQEYKQLNELYYGPDMVVDDRIAMEWARIPHFYYNYYVFQYATGYAAAVALSRRILREGEPAVKDYLSFLSGGCSRSPIELLKGAGVDMTTAEPVSQALELFDRLLDEMEALTED